MLHEFWFGHSVKQHSDAQLNKLQVENVDSEVKVSVKFKVELSDDTGFDDASWCQEFGVMWKTTSHRMMSELIWKIESSF